MIDIRNVRFTFENTRLKTSEVEAIVSRALRILERGGSEEVEVAEGAAPANIARAIQLEINRKARQIE